MGSYTQFLNYNMKAGKKQTVDGWAFRIFWLLQTRHGQSSLNPHVGELVGDTDQHSLVDVIEEVIVNLGILCHTAQQLVDQLAHAETHSMAVGFMRLQRQESKRGARIGEKEGDIRCLGVDIYRHEAHKQ